MIKAKRFYAISTPTYFCFNPQKAINKKAILSAFSGIILNAEIAKTHKLAKLLDYTKYRFDEHYDRFLSAGGSEREIYEIFVDSPKIWRILTSPRKRWSERIFSVKKWRHTKILTLLGFEIRFTKDIYEK